MASLFLCVSTYASDLHCELFNKDSNSVRGPFSIEELEKNSIFDSFGEFNFVGDTIFFDEKNSEWVAFKNKFTKGDKLYSEKTNTLINTITYNTILVRDKCIVERLYHYDEGHSETIVN